MRFRIVPQQKQLNGPNKFNGLLKILENMGQNGDTTKPEFILEQNKIV